MKYLTAILVISIVIIIHELGHFWAAKILRIPVARFCIGFGPKIWSWRAQKDGTEFCLSAVPLGGYVLPEISDPGSMLSLPIYKRLVFAIGGPLTNLVAAVMSFAAAYVAVKGLGLDNLVTKPLELTLYFLTEMVRSIGMAADDPSQLSGALGIVVDGASLLRNGVKDVLLFAGFINLNVALFNMLPIPVLDGGHIVLSIAEKITPGVKKIRVPLAIGGWLFILGMMIYATSNDVSRLFGT